MANKPKRASPKPRGDGNGPALEDIEDALAMEILDQENLKLMREQRKSHRTMAEAKHVNLGQLDELYKRRDDTAGDIESYFKGLFRTFSAHFQEFVEMDFFVRKTTKTEKASFGHVGLMAGLKGEDPTVPPNLVGEEIQDYERGYRKGADARNRNKRTLADTLAAVLATAPGTVIDGTTGKPLTKKQKAEVEAAAKAQFEAKQPDLEAQAKAPEAGGEGSSIKLADQPDWSAYDDDPIKWAPEQSRAFRAWFDALPAGASVQIAHAGIRKAFSAARGDGVTAADVIGVVEGGDTFEASPEEIAAQAGRKGGATDIDDPLVVDGVRHANKTRANEARRLKASQSEQAAAKRAEAGVP